MKAFQSSYNPYIVKFYVSTIFNFPSPKLLAGLPHFLSNYFSYLARHVTFSKSGTLITSALVPLYWVTSDTVLDFFHHTVGLCITLLSVHEKLLVWKSVQAAASYLLHRLA